MFRYLGCFRKLMSWRTILVLTVLATVLQAITMMLSWHVSEVERRLKDDESNANEKFSLYFKHMQSQSQSSKSHQNFKLRNNTHKQLLPYSGQLSTEHHTEYNFDHQDNKKNGNFYYGAKGLTAELSGALSTLAHQSIIDSSGQYRIARQFFIPSSSTNTIAGRSDDIAGAGSAGEVTGRVLVTLATQCSSQHLHRVPELAQTWQGPVSVAVFSQRREVQWLLQTILLLRRCYRVILANVTFSIVTPLSAGEAGQAGRELPPPLLAPLSQKRMQVLLSETASGRRLHAQYEGNEGPKDRLNRRKWKDQEKIIGSEVISFERENMLMFRRRQINSNFINFTCFGGVGYSPKYSRRKILDDKNTVIEKNVNNSVNSENSKNIYINHNSNKSPSRIINKLQQKLSAHIYENYRYISNTHHDSIEKPSPDSTSCNKLLGLSPSHLSNISSGANGSNNSSKKDEPQPNYSFNDVEYPNNLLRNVAVDAVTTEFVLVLDIDMIPSAGLLEHFSHLIRSNGLSSAGRSHVEQVLKGDLIGREGKSSETKLPNEKKFIDQDTLPNSFLLSDKLAFVLPAYEVEEDVAMPDNHEDLLKRVKEGKARPFYDQLCQKCQRPTNYSAWEQLHLPTPLLSVAYEVPWQDPWEPFYITARATLPRYDERFRQYGFNRISQVCEAHVSGFRFVVLWPAFVVHRGYKGASALHVTKERELLRNRFLFREFKQQLKTKYPMSRRRCY